MAGGDRADQHVHRRPFRPARATSASPARTADTSNIPTPYTRCRQMNSTGPAVGCFVPRRSARSAIASAISQVRGARMTGQMAGSMQWAGQSQSANET